MDTSPGATSIPLGKPIASIPAGSPWTDSGAVTRTLDKVPHSSPSWCSASTGRWEEVSSGLDYRITNRHGTSRRCTERGGDPLQRLDRVVLPRGLVAPSRVKTRLGRTDANQALERGRGDAGGALARRRRGGITPLTSRRRRSGEHGQRLPRLPARSRGRKPGVDASSSADSASLWNRASASSHEAAAAVAS